jgi:hypothetical protein
MLEEYGDDALATKWEIAAALVFINSHSKRVLSHHEYFKGRIPNILRMG